MRLGSVRGAIYKVGLETVAGDYADAVEFSSQVMELLMGSFGEASQPGEGLWLWDADDGNIVMQIANAAGERRIMIFLTSSAARQFPRK